MKPGRNPWSFFMQKNNENLGKTLTYGAPYVIILCACVIWQSKMD